jgi:hypothetical protein
MISRAGSSPRRNTMRPGVSLAGFAVAAETANVARPRRRARLPGRAAQPRPDVAPRPHILPTATPPGRRRGLNPRAPCRPGRSGNGAGGARICRAWGSQHCTSASGLARTCSWPRSGTRSGPGARRRRPEPADDGAAGLALYGGVLSRPYEIRGHGDHVLRLPGHRSLPGGRLAGQSWISASASTT